VHHGPLGRLFLRDGGDAQPFLPTLPSIERAIQLHPVARCAMLNAGPPHLVSRKKMQEDAAPTLVPLAERFLIGDGRRVTLAIAIAEAVLADTALGLAGVLSQDGLTRTGRQPETGKQELPFRVTHDDSTLVRLTTQAQRQRAERARLATETESVVRC
jgi:hypothetical protein